MQFKTYTRKQAGVIYSAMKRGAIEVSQDVIGRIYDMAGSVEIFYTSQLEGIERFAAGIKIAIDEIFADDYEAATKTLAKLA